MYDLRNDPDEMRNVYDDPAYAAMRRDAQALIEARLGGVLPTRLPSVGMA
jgi:hypothetical protein